MEFPHLSTGKTVHQVQVDIIYRNACINKVVKVWLKAIQYHRPVKQDNLCSIIKKKLKKRSIINFNNGAFVNSAAETK